MQWLKRLFTRHRVTAGVVTQPTRPPGWDLTLDDLFAEMQAGKRASVGNPEAQWAKDFERSLLSDETRFPRQGDIYEATVDQDVDYLIAWSAPLTGGGQATLYKGERIRIDIDPGEPEPLGVYALAVDYQQLEQRMVPDDVRTRAKYDGFYFHVKTAALNSRFVLIEQAVD